MGDFIQGAMKLLCLAQNDLAGQLGVPYDTVRGWSSGRADPSADNRLALAEFMRDHARKLIAAAEELEAVR